MKKLFLLCALVSSFTASAASEKVLMVDYIATDADRMFEIKTRETKFEKVVLDCQSFIQGMTFYEKGQSNRFFYIDSYQCESLHEYLQAAKENQVPVCLELDGKALDVTEIDSAECK